LKLSNTLVLFFLIILSFESYGQRASIDLLAFPTISRNYSPNFVVPYSGIGLTIGHGKNKQLEAGISFRSVPWGSEIALSEGYRIDLTSNSKFHITNTSRIYFGLPLFYNKLSLSSAASTEVSLKFKNFQRIMLIGGLRLNVNAFYRTISSKYVFPEALFGLRISVWK
jgi:hypothetical protein